MSHSINTGAEIANLNHAFLGIRTEQEVPAVQGEYNYGNPVLTVSHKQNSPAEQREVSFLFRADAIMVNPWQDSNVEIRGEDLFALRELLAEIPESAFVRPAEPVDAPRWASGDVVTFESRNLDSVFTRGPESWVIVRHDRRSGETEIDYCSDRTVDQHLDNQRAFGFTPGENATFTVRRQGGVTL